MPKFHIQDTGSIYPVTSNSIYTLLYQHNTHMQLASGREIPNSHVLILKFRNLFHNLLLGSYLWEVLLSLNNTMKRSLFPAFYAEFVTA